MLYPLRGMARFATAVVLLSCAALCMCVLLQDALEYEEGYEVAMTSSPPPRRVTKSLSRDPPPGVSDHIALFNRIPGSGGEIGVLLLQKLQGSTFRHIRLGNDFPGRMDTKQQRKFAKEIYAIIQEQAIPLSFDRVVFFTNFTEYGIQSPMYFNVIRDPLENAVSRMFSKDKYKGTHNSPKKTMFRTFAKCWQAGYEECQTIDDAPFNFQIPYFCGHDPECSKINSKFALNKAKDNVDRYYRFVGILERVNETLAAMENELPLFFKGASKEYSLHISDKFNKRKPLPGIKIRDNDMLKNIFNTEYDFYNWVKIRLLKQAKITQQNAHRYEIIDKNTVT